MTDIIMCPSCGTPNAKGCHSVCQACKKSFSEPEEFIDHFDRVHSDEDLDEFDIAE